MHVERTEPINVTKEADQPYGIVVEHDRHEVLCFSAFFAAEAFYIYYLEVNCSPFYCCSRIWTRKYEHEFRSF